jgi:hypothetical protein
MGLLLLFAARGLRQPKGNKKKKDDFCGPALMLYVQEKTKEKPERKRNTAEREHRRLLDSCIISWLPIRLRIILLETLFPWKIEPNTVHWMGDMLQKETKRSVSDVGKIPYVLKLLVLPGCWDSTKPQEQ